MALEPGASSMSAGPAGLLWLARIFGMLSITLGLLGAFAALVFGVGGQLEPALGVGWMGFVLLLAGAVPFVPALAERRWQLKALGSFVYLALLVTFLGAGLIHYLFDPEDDLVGSLVVAAVLALLALPGVWLLRKGLGPRQVPAPADDTQHHPDDPLLGQLRHAHEPTRAVLVAAGLLGWSAALAGFTGLQLLGASFVMRWLNIVPFALLAFAAALAWCALGVYRLRFTEGVAAFILAVVGTVMGGWWLVFSTRGGIVSLFAMMWPFVSAAASVCAVRQLAYLRDATKAREHLEDEGFSLGL